MPRATHLSPALKVRVLVDFPTTVPGQPGHATAQDTVISLAFQQLYQDLDSSNLDGLRVGLRALRDTLQPSSGLVKRSAKGGSQYRALFMLDSVLLADNLKSVSDTSAADETNLLRTVVSQ